LIEVIREGACGAAIVFKRNLVIEQTTDGERVDLDAAIELNRQLHAAAPTDEPLLIAVDQEGGVVQRVREPATVWPPMLHHQGLKPPFDERMAERVGRAMGRELAALGFDIDFAPVLDIHTNPKNPIIGNRAFGDNAADVARRALAYARGLALASMLSCGKHFPGHGDTTTDSHLELPRIDHAFAHLEAVELAPFVRAAPELPMIMTAHVVFAALDPSVPATLSHRVITGLLRQRLSYAGVIISDDLDMKAVASHFGIADAAVRAVAAGCDVLLLCRDPSHQEQARRALLDEAGRSSEFRARVGQSAERVRAMKARHLADRERNGVLSRAVVGCEEHRKLASVLAASALGQ
jgi:beta-N-acetylhexosaminidase